MNNSNKEIEVVATPKQLTISIPDEKFMRVMAVIHTFCGQATEYKFLHPESEVVQEFIYGKDGFAIEHKDLRLDFAMVRRIFFTSDDGESVSISEIFPRLRTMRYDSTTVYNMIVDRFSSKFILFCKYNNIPVIINGTLHVPIDLKKTGPTMHKPIPIGTRVKVIPGGLPDDIIDKVRGEIQGVASTNFFFVYILLLDEPIDVPDIGFCKCISMSGLMLEGEDGTSYQNKSKTV